MSVPNTFSDPAQFQFAPSATHIHMIGIGGVGMCALALWARDRGFFVTGSDREKSRYTALLEREGICVDIGPFSPHIRSADAVVYTLAIQSDNEELVYAMAHGIRVFSRADFLGCLSYSYPIRIAVSGMHGKSTVTAMIGKILKDAKKAPTVLCGASVNGDSPYLCGGGSIVVYEACEYGDSFLATNPTIAVLNNIDYDHPDWFEDMTAVKCSFSTFLRKETVKTAVVNGDDPLLREIASDATCQKIYTGLQFDQGIHASDIVEGDRGIDFLLKRESIALGRLRLPVFGIHNVENAIIAASVALLLDIPFSKISISLSGFTGIPRRMEKKGDFMGAEIYDDYAHHPKELLSALKGARAINRRGRVICIFQPHTYSRVSSMHCEFANVLRLADEHAIMSVFAAREKENPSASGFVLAEESGGVYLPTHRDASEWLVRTVKEGDIVLLAGAGDIYRVWDLLKERVLARNA